MIFSRYGVILASVCSMFASTVAIGDDWLLNHFPTEATPDLYFRPVVECDVCPQMVILPGGEFTMGSPDGEQGRNQNEGPMHTVRIGKPFAMGKYEIAVAQFREFVKNSGYVTTAERNIGKPGCYGWPGINRFKLETTSTAARWIAGNYWDHTGVPQDERDPVRCVSLEDAQAYVDWLNRKSPSGGYRIPSEAEWEYAARAGSTTPWFWGDRKDAACRFANINDLNGTRMIKNVECSDGIPYVANVGSFTPNPFGLHDTSGNAAEWVADCYHDSYKDAPVDGRPWGTSCGSKVAGVVRGGFYAMPGDAISGVRSAAREAVPQLARTDGIGFRVAKSIP